MLNLTLKQLAAELAAADLKSICAIVNDAKAKRNL